MRYRWTGHPGPRLNRRGKRSPTAASGEANGQSEPMGNARRKEKARREGGGQKGRLEEMGGQRGTQQGRLPTPGFGVERAKSSKKIGAQRAAERKRHAHTRAYARSHAAPLPIRMQRRGQTHKRTKHGKGSEKGVGMHQGTRLRAVSVVFLFYFISANRIVSLLMRRWRLASWVRVARCGRWGLGRAPRWR